MASSSSSSVGDFGACGELCLVEDSNSRLLQVARRTPVTEQGLTIGRGADRDLVLHAQKGFENMISRKHARVRFSPEQRCFVLEDEGSVNGTFVDSVRIKETPLRNGAVITFGGGQAVKVGRHISSNTSPYVFCFREATPAPSPVSQQRKRTAHEREADGKEGLHTSADEPGFKKPKIPPSAVRSPAAAAVAATGSTLRANSSAWGGRRMATKSVTMVSVDSPNQKVASQAPRPTIEASTPTEAEQQKLVIHRRQLKVLDGEAVGAGASAAVYRAQYYGHDVAVKKIHETQDTRRMFINELHLLRNCMSPHVLQLYGYFEDADAGCVHLVAEFMHGGSLDGILHPKGELPLYLPFAHRLDFAVQVSMGMAYLHNCTPVIKHLDLKPDNCLVSKAPEQVDSPEGSFLAYSSPPVIKIADLGLSRQNQKQLEQTMSMCGTPLYMAPEVALNEHFWESADVFSFGIMLWEIITRGSPYEEFVSREPTLFVFIRCIAEEGLRPDVEDCPEDVPEEYWARLVQIMQACWAREPRDRPHMNDVCDELSKIKEMFAEEFD